ncbi:hypothetical protein NUU17_25645, partial [Escherichia coli]|uniref:hypothetical protein n=1 Tax=Escherichia coli TaxID=562 RepID=UPI00214F7216
TGYAILSINIDNAGFSHRTADGVMTMAFSVLYLAAGYLLCASCTLFAREQVELLWMRNIFNNECRNLEKVNEANAKFWSEQDEKAKR